MWSVSSRRSDASTTSRMCAGRLSTPETVASWKRKPNFVAMVAAWRRPLRARPSSASLVNGP